MYYPVLSHPRISGDFWTMEMIRVPDMLNVMNQRDGNGDYIPFSLTWVTCNKKQHTGGEKITLDRAVLCSGGKIKAEKYNPDHFENYTRNIRAACADRIMKIHVLLVTRFNGAKINGKLWLATTPTIAELAPGANVYTANETAKMMSGSLGDKLYQPTSYSIDNDTALKAEMQYRSPVSAPSFPSSSVTSTNQSKAPAQSEEMATMQKALSDFMQKQMEIKERPITFNYKTFEDFKENNIDQVRMKQGMCKEKP